MRTYMQVEELVRLQRTSATSTTSRLKAGGAVRASLPCACMHVHAWVHQQAEGWRGGESEPRSRASFFVHACMQVGASSLGPLELSGTSPPSHQLMEHGKEVEVLHTSFMRAAGAASRNTLSSDTALIVSLSHLDTHLNPLLDP